MDPLAMFIPLAKADAATRMVYGSFDETPDRAREICDYATARPAFEAWSGEMQKASFGKSLGNIRAQHDMKKAAGKLVELTFDDDAKSISFAAKIVDDQDWEKVEQGVYTGFSPGGSYAKRWADPSNPGCRRYTPRVGELSIVDVPCNPNATFTMVKADGAEEEISFVLDKAYEPGNDATKARADEMAKAAGQTGHGKNFVVQARADLIAENAVEALAKSHYPVEAETAPAIEGGLTAAQKLDAALVKADGGAASEITMTSPFTPSDAAIALIGADLAKSFYAVEAIATAIQPLAKSMYSIVDVAGQLRSFKWIVDEVVCDAKYTDRMSELPQLAVDIIRAMKTFLIAMVEEEVAYLLSSTKEWAESASVAQVIELDIGDDGLAKSIIELVSADADLMAKAGARNSSKDAKSIQSIHDESCNLGAACTEAVTKVAALEAENADLLAKAAAHDDRMEKAAGTIDRITGEHVELKDDLAKALGRITALEASPAAPKGNTMAMDKTEDMNGGPLAKSDVDKPKSVTEAVAGIPAGPQRARAILEHVGKR